MRYQFAIYDGAILIKSQNKPKVFFLADGAHWNHSHQSDTFIRLETGFFHIFLQRRQLSPASGFGSEFRDPELDTEHAGEPVVLDVPCNWLCSVVAGRVDSGVLRAWPSHRGAGHFDC